MWVVDAVVTVTSAAAAPAKRGNPQETQMTTKRKKATADGKRFAALIHVMACCIYGYGATPQEATQNAIRQARRDLQGVFKFPKVTEWVGNVYEVNGQDWLYDSYDGFTLEDGTQVQISEHVRMQG
jgi:hypothetical protein